MNLELKIRKMTKERLTKARQAKNWSVRQTVIATNLSAATIYITEREGCLNLTTLIPYSRALGLELHFNLIDLRYEMKELDSGYGDRLLPVPGDPDFKY